MELRVHLKVCEGCGCLWYRAQVDTRVYCSPCHERFKEFPTPQSRKRRGRPKKTVLSTVFAVHEPVSIAAIHASGLQHEGYRLQPMHYAYPQPGVSAPGGMSAGHLFQHRGTSSLNAAGAQ